LASKLAQQSHRRSIKTHLPLDGLPIYDEVKYIHVARDGRDVCLSYHNHCLAHTDESLAAMNRVGAQDLTLQRPYPEVPKDPADFFHAWLTRGAIDGQEDGSPFLSYFAFEKTYSSGAHLDNLLFVHYADLKQNLVEEMARIADFIEVSVDRATLVKLAESASFETMRKEGMALIPRTAKLFRGEAERLFYKGQIGRWRDLFEQEDLELFEQKLKVLPGEYANWLIAGSGDYYPMDLIFAGHK
jgi:aryl sulfotransferase